MIAVDTSALIAMVKNEESADICSQILDEAPKVIISAGTLLEARIVASRANLVVELDAILNAAIAEVIPVTDERAIFMSQVYQMWGKGFHTASLNFGDCFAYATAKEFACPLYIGNEFGHTDIASAITPEANVIL